MKRFIKKIHMAGIGGAGMCPLAEVLLSRGHSVSGSDKIISEATRYLEQIGIKIQYDHELSLIAGADLLVYSSAIADDNPERKYAMDNGIPAIRRAEMLGDVMRAGFAVCVSGTHGKTTTTSLIGTILAAAGISPTVLVGGMMKCSKSHAIVGNGNVFVAEADEYDRSFLAMYPSISVITNIDADHFDCYRDLNDIKDTFVQFTERVSFDGAVVVCVDSDNVVDILPRIRRNVITYGVGNGDTDNNYDICNHIDYRAVNINFENGKTTFDVLIRGKLSGSITIHTMGLYNVRNALAAVAVAFEIGIEFDKIASSIFDFQGVKRRFEIVGMVNGAVIVDDYAHHPGEITAVFDAARSGGYSRIIAVFQPHLYTRTRDFLEEFAVSLSGANVVLVTDIYKAREQPIPGVDAGNIVDRINGIGKSEAVYVKDKNEIVERLRGNIGEGDLIIFMGAGDIWESACRLVKEGAMNE